MPIGLDIVRSIYPNLLEMVPVEGFKDKVFFADKEISTHPIRFNKFSGSTGILYGVVVDEITRKELNIQICTHTKRGCIIPSDGLILSDRIVYELYTKYAIIVIGHDIQALLRKFTIANILDHE